MVEIFTARKRSLGKVMFLHLSVVHSVHMGVLCMMSIPVWLPFPIFLLGISVPGPMVLPGGLSPGGSLSRESLHVGRPSPLKSEKWYASYWNAFLYLLQI